MNPIALVLVCTASHPSSSEEFRYGWNMLRRATPANAIWIETQEGSAAGIGQALQASAAASRLPGNALVLLLAHGHVLLTRVVQERLCQALLQNPALTAVHAFDSRFAPPSQAPDYCTVRGLERYLDQLGRPAPAPPAMVADDGQRQPLVTVTRLAYLREQRVRSQAAWMTSAFVHDFADYHQGRREEVLPLIPTSVMRVLDVGGGEGGFLQALKQARGCETHLAEYSKQACELALPHVDHVWPGDFFTQPFAGLPQQGQQAFDCITFLDVLEHAVDPSAWLVRARALLAPEGVVVASIPNVGHWGVIADLLEGRWDYCPVGIHCVTHLRFFTEQGVEELLAQSGYTIEQCERVQVPCPPQWQQHWAQTPGLQVNTASWNTYAFLIRARPVASHASPTSPSITPS